MRDADAAKENQLTGIGKWHYPLNKRHSGIGENEDFNRRSPLLYPFTFEMP